MSAIKQTRLQKLREKEKMMRAKWKAAVKQGRQVKKLLMQKFAKKVATLKKKIKITERLAYQHAFKDIQQHLADKEKAKAKLLKAAEQQFEKQYAAKLKKKGKIKLGKKAKTTVSYTGKRRGRPPKNQAASIMDSNHHIEPDQEFENQKG